MHINQNLTSYLGVPTDGYIGIGANPTDVRSRLTITGTNNVPQFGGGGYRSWMKTGIFNLENSDNLYIGLKAEGLNRSDAVLAFGDDNAGLPNPLNNFRILFTNAASPNSSHLEIARYTAGGNIGFGPVFGDNNLLVPKSLLHMNMDGSKETWLQLSNQGATGMLATDGLRLGVPAGVNPPSILGWQENSPFIVQTDWNNTPGGINSGERMRISSTNSPGVPSTMMNIQNTTRVSISYLGHVPLTQPRALLHLGVNNGSTVANWMDFGTLTSNTQDATFIGLTPGNYSDPNQSVIGFGGTNLVFIESGDTEVARFDAASNFLAVGDYSPTGAIASAPTERIDVDGNGRFRNVPAQGGQSIILGLEQGTTPEDIELSRLAFPNDSTQVLLGNGTWGTASGSNGMIQPTIDCSTGVLTLGIENVDTVSVNLSCLMGTGGTGAVHNGLSTSTTLPGYFALGQNLGGTGGQLLNNREVPMNNNNIVFSNNGSTNYSQNRIGLGTTNPQAKFHVNLDNNISSGPITQGILVENHAISTNGKGIKIEMSNHSMSSFGTEININSITNTTSTNHGFRTYIEGGSINRGAHVSVKDGVTSNIGVETKSEGGNVSKGIESWSWDGVNNFGGDFRGMSQSTTPITNNYGIYAAAGVAQNSYGVFAQANGGTSSNYAGYFAGQVYVGSLIVGSDENLKTNIAPLNNGMSLINQLEPKTFEFDQIGHPSMSLSSGLQYGLIAQEVEQIIPEIVSENTQPAVLDSLGNISIAEVQFKGLEYEQLIPIMIKGMQEQDDRIDSLTNLNSSVTNYNDSLENVVSDLNDRLTNLENCLSNILQGLCNANQQAVSQTPEEIKEQLRSIIDVELSDKNSIVLNQNVPNPFAERTVISYSVPSSVQRAQIHFYDMNGVLINSVDITERGEGQINVYANDLSSGIYTYSLVADGKVVSTKKMMKN